ncbi:hypothetical protein, partial [Streptococcus pneumoniae]|uniref:hypothetical protein n=2 Tax=Streptococcus pneumoniae TaxID=1313 RepID=UPI001CEFAB2C
LSKIGLTTTLKNAWTTSRQVNFFWVANFNLKFGNQFLNKNSWEHIIFLIIRLGLCDIFISVIYTDI